MNSCFVITSLPPAAAAKSVAKRSSSSAPPAPNEPVSKACLPFGDPADATTRSSAGAETERDVDERRTSREDELTPERAEAGVGLTELHLPSRFRSKNERAARAAGAHRPESFETVAATPGMYAEMVPARDDSESTRRRLPRSARDVI